MLGDIVPQTMGWILHGFVNDTQSNECPSSYNHQSVTNLFQVDVEPDQEQLTHLHKDHDRHFHESGFPCWQWTTKDLSLSFYSTQCKTIIHLQLITRSISIIARSLASD